MTTTTESALREALIDLIDYVTDEAMERLRRKGGRLSPIVEITRAEQALGVDVLEHHGTGRVEHQQTYSRTSWDACPDANLEADEFIAPELARIGATKALTVYGPSRKSKGVEIFDDVHLFMWTTDFTVCRVYRVDPSDWTLTPCEFADVPLQRIHPLPAKLRHHVMRDPVLMAAKAAHVAAVEADRAAYKAAQAVRGATPEPAVEPVVAANDQTGEPDPDLVLMVERIAILQREQEQNDLAPSSLMSKARAAGIVAELAILQAALEDAATSNTTALAA